MTPFEYIEILVAYKFSNFIKDNGFNNGAIAIVKMIKEYISKRRLTYVFASRVDKYINWPSRAKAKLKSELNARPIRRAKIQVGFSDTTMSSGRSQIILYRHPTSFP